MWNQLSANRITFEREKIKVSSLQTKIADSILIGPCSTHRTPAFIKINNCDTSTKETKAYGSQHEKGTSELR